MSLTSEIDEQSPIFKRLKHVYITDATGDAIALITGVAGKKIRVWRMLVSCGTAGKNCVIRSRFDPFTTLYGQNHDLQSSDGVPVFTCNAGNDLQAYPSEAQVTWNYHIVYSIK